MGKLKQALLATIWQFICKKILNVQRSGRPGRSKFEITVRGCYFGIALLYGFTWKQIADMLLVSRWRRRVIEYGLQETAGFSALSDEQVDFYVKHFFAI